MQFWKYILKCIVDNKICGSIIWRSISIDKYKIFTTKVSQ